MTKKIIIGTRGSALALKQAEMVRESLMRQYQDLDVELRIIRTTGDQITGVALTQIGSVGIFTRTIEEHLLRGKIDLAVHSLKDMPTELTKGLTIAAVPPREDAADVLISRGSVSLDQLPAGAKILCGSLRRRAQLWRKRADLQMLDVRGNVPTRLGRLDQGEAEAVVLAAAGLKRLGLASRIVERFDPMEFLPACGQGALALETRCDDKGVVEFVKALDDAPSRSAAFAERAVLNTLHGGCQIPLGAYGRVNGEKLSLLALISDLSGKRVVTASGEGQANQPEQLGRIVADKLRQAGAEEILADMRGPEHVEEP
jgi:hydroxymethylbilane synthase